MTMAIGKMQEYAPANNFVLAVKDHKPTRVYLKYTKDEQYKNTRGIKDKDRKMIPSSEMTGLPFPFEGFLQKVHQRIYLILKATNNIEAYHNHPLDDECLESTPKDILSKVNVDDAREIIRLVESKAKTRDIQKAINDDEQFGHKLYVSDINNINAEFTRATAPGIQDAGTKLINDMEAKGYQVQYDINDNGLLERIMFSHPKMLESARRFPEVMVVDATYSTNNLEMPLICVKGVHNLGRKTLKSFPIAFARVSNEQQDSYLWFLEQLKRLVFRDMPCNTLFGTDKCAALMSALDIVFPNNDKFLCYWHMLNSVEKAPFGKLKSVAEKEVLMEYVSRMAHSTEKEEFDVALTKFNAVSAGLDVEDGKEKVSPSVYFTSRWVNCREKWAGYLTCKQMDFECIATQIVESAHRALKRGISAISSLGLAFDAVATYVNKLERDFSAIKIR